MVLFCSTLGRIIKVSDEVLAYRDWTIKKWGAKQYAKPENHGKWIGCGSAVFFFFYGSQDQGVTHVLELHIESIV